MKIIRTGLLLLSVLLPATAVLPAEAQPLKVVYTEWFPYTYEAGGQPAGFEIEICQAVLTRMGIPAEFDMYSWMRCLAYLGDGRADALVSMLYTPERARYACYPDEHVSISRTVFFTTCTRDLNFSGSYEDLKDCRIGVIMGFDYGEDFARADYLRKDEAPDAQTLLVKLLHGRNDLIAENQAVVTATARKMGVADCIRPLDPPIHTQKLYVGFSRIKARDRLCAEFSRALAEFKQTEEYRDILRKYSVEHSQTAIQGE